MTKKENIKLKNNKYWDSSSIIHNRKNLKDILEKKTLWKNNNPDTIFNAQTVKTLDDSDFNYIVLIYDAYAPYQNYATYILKKPERNYDIPFYSMLMANGVVTLRERFIKRNNSTSYSFTRGDENGVMNNNICVPIEMIGFNI